MCTAGLFHIALDVVPRTADTDKAICIHSYAYWAVRCNNLFWALFAFLSWKANVTRVTTFLSTTSCREMHGCILCLSPAHTLLLGPTAWWEQYPYLSLQSHTLCWRKLGILGNMDTLETMCLIPQICPCISLVTPQRFILFQKFISSTLHYVSGVGKCLVLWKLCSLQPAGAGKFLPKFLSEFFKLLSVKVGKHSVLQRTLTLHQ